MGTITKITLLFIFVIFIGILTVLKTSQEHPIHNMQFENPNIVVVEGMSGWKLIGEKNGCKLYHQTFRNNQSVFWAINADGSSSVTAIQPY